MSNVHVHTIRVRLLCCLFWLFCFVLLLLVIFCLFYVLFVVFVFFFVCFIVCFDLFWFVVCFIVFFLFWYILCAHEYHIIACMIYCCDITVQSIILTLVRLHDLQHLLILYPNKRKDEVFGKYYAPPRKWFCCVHGWMLPCSQVLEKREGELVPMFTHTKSHCCNLHTIGIYTEIPPCV